MLEIDVWNPLPEEFEGNDIAVRSGFELLYATGPLEAGERRLIELPLAVSVYNEALSISVRSRIEWQPPPPDMRRVGFTLSRWLCRVETSTRPTETSTQVTEEPPADSSDTE